MSTQERELTEWLSLMGQLYPLTGALQALVEADAVMLRPHFNSPAQLQVWQTFQADFKAWLQAKAEYNAKYPMEPGR